MDLFDALGIGTRENSYTTFIAFLFGTDQGQEWARNFFRSTCDLEAPLGRVKVESQLRLRHRGTRGSDIPDVVFAFGEPAEIVLVVEAKIKSDEGYDQLRRYERSEARRKIVEALKLSVREPGEIDHWCYLYMTLEGERPTSEMFEPVTYEKGARGSSVESRYGAGISIRL